jgi:hypothetical protein
VFEHSLTWGSVVITGARVALQAAQRLWETGMEAGWLGSGSSGIWAQGLWETGMEAGWLGSGSSGTWAQRLAKEVLCCTPFSMLTGPLLLWQPALLPAQV